MTATIDAATLKAWLSDGGEIALLDVREDGQFGEGHLFFAVPLPYSRFELGLPALVPNPAVRLVLCDGGEEAIAGRAAKRAEALGYRNVHVLEGGDAGLAARGLHALRRRQRAEQDLRRAGRAREAHAARHARRTSRPCAAPGENFVIVDGRPFAEYRKMNIPGGICCPNGELALRIGDIVPDPKTKIVVNCAGRTRSIIGAQTLIDFGVANPVYALENGTQGWFARRTRARARREPALSRRSRAPPTRRARKARARALAEAHGVTFVTPREAKAWLADPSRTTYLLDVRTPRNSPRSAVPGFAHAPGGQLVQATDQWVGVKGARLVLIDDGGRTRAGDSRLAAPARPRGLRARGRGRRRGAR